MLENKHIPGRYLRASESQRRELLAGLMDTDGTCLPSGACEFYSTNARLAADARELLAGLGIKCQVREGTARLNGVDCGRNTRIKFTMRAACIFAVQEAQPAGDQRAWNAERAL